MSMLSQIMHDDLVDACAATLLSTEPNIQALQNEFTRLGKADCQTAERILYETVLSINRKLFPPLSHLELLLVEGCNMACHYCFESAVLQSGQNRKRLMSNETIRRAIDLLFDHGEPESEIDVTLLGGEPMLNFNGIRFATEYLEAKSAEAGRQHRLNVTTNGLLLTEDIIRFLAEHRIMVLLSMDGLALSHDRYRVDKKGGGTFDRVAAALRLLKDLQPWIGVKMTIMPSEAGDLFENVRGLYELGANQFLIGHATGVYWPEDAIDTYGKQISLLRDWYRGRTGNDVRISEFDEPRSEQPVFGCRAARSAIAVNVSGEITGCSRIATLESQKSIGKLGDVRFGLYALKNRMDMVGCQRLIENCRALALGNEYRAGCFAVNYEDGGDLYAPNLVEHNMRNRWDQVIRN